jgi:hypothetical protein
MAYPSGSMGRPRSLCKPNVSGMRTTWRPRRPAGPRTRSGPGRRPGPGNSAPSRNPGRTRRTRLAQAGILLRRAALVHQRLRWQTASSGRTQPCSTRKPRGQPRRGHYRSTRLLDYHNLQSGQHLIEDGAGHGAAEQIALGERVSQLRSAAACSSVSTPSAPVCRFSVSTSSKMARVKDQSGESTPAWAGPWRNRLARG